MLSDGWDENTMIKLIFNAFEIIEEKNFEHREGKWEVANAPRIQTNDHISGLRVTRPSDFAIRHKAVSREFRSLSLSVTATERLLESGIRMDAGGVLRVGAIPTLRCAYPPGGFS
jgi:hypothetical protein